MNNGILGEAKVLAYLIEQGYEVFTQFSGKAPFDLVAYKDGRLYRVSVKSTIVRAESGAYIVQLKQGSINRTGTIIKNFDADASDLLAVYVIPEDKVILLDSKTITNKSSINVRL